MSSTGDIQPGRSGLEELRALLRDGRMGGIGATVGFTLVEIEEGRVVFEGTPGPHVYNPIGSAHGGFSATLLDGACGCAVHTRLRSGQGYTTLELKVAYHKGMTDKSGRVRAEGRVVSIGRRAAFADARLIDPAGMLYASATSTLLVIDR